MLWPVPINVRMSPILANQLLDVTAGCASEEREIFDFPGGRRFHFREPGGGEFAVWDPRDGKLIVTS